MRYRASGAWVILLVVAHGCVSSGPGPVSPGTTEPTQSVRRIENPADRSVSIILDPMEVEAELPGGRLRIGGMYVQNGGSGPDGGAVLVLQVERARGDEVFASGARLQLEADGVRLPPARVDAGRLHRSRRTDQGWQETLLVPIPAVDLRRVARAESAHVHLTAGPSLPLDRRIRSGLAQLVQRLPASAFDEPVLTRAASQSEASPSTQPR